MERLTEKRDGKNVIPLRNAVCGIDMPYWKVSKANDLEAFLYGAAADKLAAYEDGDSPSEDDGEWEVVPGGVTPGGDPWLRCPFCKAKNSEHLGGIEMPKRWNYCPNCGKRLWGDGHFPVKKEETSG